MGGARERRLTVAPKVAGRRCRFSHTRRRMRAGRRRMASADRCRMKRSSMTASDERERGRWRCPSLRMRGRTGDIGAGCASSGIECARRAARTRHSFEPRPTAGHGGAHAARWGAGRTYARRARMRCRPGRRRAIFIAAPSEARSRIDAPAEARGPLVRACVTLESEARSSLHARSAGSWSGCRWRGPTGWAFSGWRTPCGNQWAGGECERGFSASASALGDPE